MNTDMDSISRRLLLLALIFLLIIASCNRIDRTTLVESNNEFTLLTYNVAGLPETISPSNPAKNTILMSPLLNNFDIVLVQEDFFYHEDLASKANHRYQSEPKAIPSLFDKSDGLNRFSNFQWQSYARQTWSACSNNDELDCLVKKGFTYARTWLTDDVFIDIYNLHLDAGPTDEDIAARTTQIKELITEINVRSSGSPVIIAGDTNLDSNSREADRALIELLKSSVFVTTACEIMQCGNATVDKVLYRGSNWLDLQVIGWEQDRRFVDGSGKKLSDHLAIAVRFQWQKK